MVDIAEVVTKSAQETFDLGRKTAAGLKGGPAFASRPRRGKPTSVSRPRRGGEVLALTGPLGAGKTTFVQGLASGLGIKGRIISPTYVLMREYEVGKEQRAKGLEKLYHVDFYRLDRAEEEVEMLGLPEIWESSGNVVVIEWAEKVRSRLPKRTRWIRFGHEGEGRRITLK